jgi:hypothetical protein
MRILKLISLTFAGMLLASLTPGAQAAPAAYSSAVAETAVCGDMVVKAVTRAGVAHRSARRTSRRVVRRRTY